MHRRRLLGIVLLPALVVVRAVVLDQQVQFRDGNVRTPAAQPPRQWASEAGSPDAADQNCHAALSDQGTDDVAAEEGPVLVALDEWPAVDHFMLLQARVPLPDLVHGQIQ
jgi:hypothetical protein